MPIQLSPRWIDKEELHALPSHGFKQHVIDMTVSEPISDDAQFGRLAAQGVGEVLEVSRQDAARADRTKLFTPDNHQGAATGLSPI